MTIYQLPLLKPDGVKLVQSGAIVHYITRKYKLYDKSGADEVHCDIIDIIMLAD